MSPIFDSVNVKSYTRTDKPELGERVGFRSQDVRQACLSANLPNTLTSDIILEDDTTLLGLDYARLVTVLWSKVKQLENRIKVLESQ